MHQPKLSQNFSRVVILEHVQKIMNTPAYYAKHSPFLLPLDFLSFMLVTLLLPHNCSFIWFFLLF